MSEKFYERLAALEQANEQLIETRNERILPGNGIVDRYKNPVLTAAHVPLFWKYDLNPEQNPYLMERTGINAVLNAGAIKFNNKYVVIARVEANDRKSFFSFV